MSNATDFARARHKEAVNALQEWGGVNKQRTELANTVQKALDAGLDTAAAMTAYMKLSELEMVQAGAAIMALSTCLVAFDSGYREKTGESLIEQLSAPSGTQDA